MDLEIFKLVWDGVVFQISGCYLHAWICIAICTLIFLSLSLSLSLSWRTCSIYMFFLLAYSKKCAHTPANLCFEFGLEKDLIVRAQADFEMFLFFYKQITRWISSWLKKTLLSYNSKVYLSFTHHSIFHDGISKWISVRSHWPMNTRRIPKFRGWRHPFSSATKIDKSVEKQG